MDRVFVTALMVAFAGGSCVSSSPLKSSVGAGPPSRLAADTRPVLPFGSPFVPGIAGAARKAKLLALAPQIDELHRKRLVETGSTGGAVAILLEGEIVYAHGFGVRDKTSQAPVDIDTLFRVGSVSKTVTGLAVMRLRDLGKLELDAPAARYYPPLTAVVGPTKDAPVMTVRHLLTMTSGLAFDDLWGAVSFGTTDAELERWVAEGLRFAGAPGERYRYSNLGFALLGKIVERTSGKTFATFVAEEIFAPLGMSSSGYVTGTLPTSRFAVGYDVPGEQAVAEPITSDGVFAPAGGVYTSLRDLARYAAFHLAAYPPRDDPESGPVRRSTLREMQAGQAWARWADDEPVLQKAPDGTARLSAMSYGLGWAQNTTCFAEAMVQHGGYEPGYYAAIRLLPREGLGVVTLSTTGSLGRLAGFEQLAALLRTGGVLAATAMANATAAPALTEARDNIVRWLETSDPSLVDRIFDPQSQRFSLTQHFFEELKEARRALGTCRAEGEVVPLSRAHGRFRLACTRGALELVAFLTPAASSSRIQMIEWRQERMPREIELARGMGLVPRIGHELPIPQEWLAPSADRHALEVRLARWGAMYGVCAGTGRWWNDGHGQTTLRLRCARGELDFSLRLEPKTDRVLDLSAAEPRPFGAACAE